MLFLFSSARKRASEGFGVALAIHGCAMDCQCDMYVMVCQCDMCAADCQCDMCFVMKETIVVVIFCVGVLMVIVKNICG